MICEKTVATSNNEVFINSLYFLYIEAFEHLVVYILLLSLLQLIASLFLMTERSNSHECLQL